MTSINNETLRKEIEQLTSNFPLDQRCDVLMLVDHINHYQLVQLKEMVTAISPKIQQRSRYNDPLVFEPLTRFIKELGLWNNYGDQCHLMFICTILKTPSDLPLIQEISFMLVNKQWIPFESKYEYDLIEEMIESKRQFIKGLRYNLPSNKPLASLVAVDTVPKPTGMYIIPSNESEAYIQGIEQMIEESDYAAWQWEIEKAMPGLPEKDLLSQRGE